jgi:hypothetical protein
VEGVKNFPFRVKRVFYLYDIPAGESRGAHAHKECHQFLIAASGARIRYAITNCYEVSLQGEFLSSQAAFPFQTASTSRIENKTITILNISAGLVLYLF